MHSWPSPQVLSIPGVGPALRLFDTADKQIRPVSPGLGSAAGQLNDPQPLATMYVCGITPYDATHLGHAATYLTFDLIHRYWLDQGFAVHYVQNVTDVDDPLFERAARDGIDWRDLGARETALFHEDMTALAVLPPRDYVGAIESIDEVVVFVQKLLADGKAYIVDDSEYPDIYFRIGATAQFGYESGYDGETMRKFFAERGGDPERPGKENPLDALLWRAQRPDEPSWPSPLGSGRPGWHIECAAIAANRLGSCIDIQGGGTDLIFPHHEFSAAHVEAATGTQRFARHYVHTAMIGLDGEKMSKSKGNLVFVSQLRRDGIDPSAIRLGLYSGHYRTERSWDDDILNTAVVQLNRWRQAAKAVKAPNAETVIQQLRNHLANDLDTVKALAAVDAWATATLNYEGEDTDAPTQVSTAVAALLGIDLAAKGISATEVG